MHQTELKVGSKIIPSAINYALKSGTEQEKSALKCTIKFENLRK